MTDPLDIARQRIAEEAEAKTGRLDLSLIEDLRVLPEDIARLSHLKILGLTNTQVSDLSPLKNLTSLVRLDFADTLVDDLRPLSVLASLRDVEFAGALVFDLAPLSKLYSLEIIDCSETPVSDLAPLTALTSLQSIDCSSTAVSDFTPLLALPLLSRIRCICCRIENFPEQLWRSPSLEIVVTDHAEISGLPYELLSQDWRRDCVRNVRAHLDDLGQDPEPLTDVKLMILGNGRVGKTQIKNRMRGEPFEEEADSTHGISVSKALIPGTSDRFNIWDFGGQDIYFGTHMLFLKSRAVFMLVWTPEADDAESHEHQGMTFRNQPVAWWLDCIRHFSRKKSPLIVVQNQIDRDGNRGEHPALAGVRDQLSLCGSVGYSAYTDEGRGVLDGYLKDAAKRFNPPLIGRGRLQVMRKLQAWLEEDGQRASEDKQHRLLAFEDFIALCEATDQVSNPKQFLKFLHHAGIVFWQDGLFQNQVILDQGWVLEAIYTVFHRKHCLKTLRDRHGRFTRHDLAMMIWDREGFSEDEQQLFLSFMLSCGICFELRPATDDVEAEYIAPDHLPEAWDACDRLDRWGEANADAARSFDYESLPPALMRNLIGRIGSRAGLKLEYWRNGFYGFERETRSKILVEQAVADGWVGCIHIQARGPEAGRLVERMAEALREEEQRLGLSSTEPDGPGIEREEKTAEAQPLDFAYEPSEEKSYFISYAWADDETEEGTLRTEIVDEFCERALALGMIVQRDKDVMRIGDSITKFMDRLARGDRVIVILSDKYLRSPFCMYELYEIWRLAGSDKDQFRERIRAFRLEDAVIGTPFDRVKYAIYWKAEYEKYDPIVKEHGLDVFGTEDAQKVIHMSRFRMHIGDILAAVADILQPSNVEELLTYSFDDPGGYRAAS